MIARLPKKSANFLHTESGERNGFPFQRAIVRCAICSFALLLAVFIAQPAHSGGVEDFYRGKTVSLLIGYSVGGGYDAYGRLVARHLGKHIPGNPSVVPQNMSGAGSLKAALTPASGRSSSTRISTPGISIRCCGQCAPDSIR